MPSKIVRCDFCDTDHRKTDLPTHIKAKHMAELAKYIVEDAKVCSSNVINSYMRGACVKTMPIPSRLYDGTDYWFGVRPIMIEEKDNVTPYLAIDCNLDSHRAFIEELMDYISLNDYISIGRLTQIRCPEMDIMKDSLKQRDEELSRLTKRHATDLLKITEEIENCRKTIEDVNEGVTHKELRHQIHELQKNVSVANTKLSRMKEDYDTLKWRYDELEKNYGELYLSSKESRSMVSIELEEAYIKRVELLQEALRKEREKVVMGKKEAKTSDKKKEEKERMKAELKAARAKAKALAKKLSDSDSDSDSD